MLLAVLPPLLILTFPQLLTAQDAPLATGGGFSARFVGIDPPVVPARQGATARIKLRFSTGIPDVQVFDPGVRCAWRVTVSRGEFVENSLREIKGTCQGFSNGTPPGGLTRMQTGIIVMNRSQPEVIVELTYKVTDPAPGAVNISIVPSGFSSGSDSDVFSIGSSGPLGKVLPTGGGSPNWGVILTLAGIGIGGVLWVLSRAGGNPQPAVSRGTGRTPIPDSAPDRSSNPSGKLEKRTNSLPSGVEDLPDIGELTGDRPAITEVAGTPPPDDLPDIDDLPDESVSSAEINDLPDFDDLPDLEDDSDTVLIDDPAILDQDAEITGTIASSPTGESEDAPDVDVVAIADAIDHASQDENPTGNLNVVSGDNANEILKRTQESIPGTNYVKAPSATDAAKLPVDGTFLNTTFITDPETGKKIEVVDLTNPRNTIVVKDPLPGTVGPATVPEEEAPPVHEKPERKDRQTRIEVFISKPGFKLTSLGEKVTALSSVLGHARGTSRGLGSDYSLNDADVIVRYLDEEDSEWREVSGRTDLNGEFQVALPPSIRHRISGVNHRVADRTAETTTLVETMLDDFKTAVLKKIPDSTVYQSVRKDLIDYPSSWFLQLCREKQSALPRVHAAMGALNAAISYHRVYSIRYDADRQRFLDTYDGVFGSLISACLGFANVRKLGLGLPHTVRKFTEWLDNHLGDGLVAKILAFPFRLMNYTLDKLINGRRGIVDGIQSIESRVSGWLHGISHRADVKVGSWTSPPGMNFLADLPNNVFQFVAGPARTGAIASVRTFLGCGLAAITMLISFFLILCSVFVLVGGVIFGCFVSLAFKMTGNLMNSRPFAAAAEAVGDLIYPMVGSGTLSKPSKLLDLGGITWVEEIYENALDTFWYKFWDARGRNVMNGFGNMAEKVSKGEALDQEDGKFIERFIVPPEDFEASGAEVLRRSHLWSMGLTAPESWHQNLEALSEHEKSLNREMQNRGEAVRQFEELMAFATFVSDFLGVCGWIKGIQKIFSKGLELLNKTFKTNIPIPAFDFTDWLGFIVAIADFVGGTWNLGRDGCNTNLWAASRPIVIRRLYEK